MGTALTLFILALLPFIGAAMPFDFGFGPFDDSFSPFGDVFGNIAGPDYLAPGPNGQFPPTPILPPRGTGSGRSIASARDMPSIFISHITIPTADLNSPGDLVPVFVTMENNGDIDLDDTKAILMIPELGIRSAVGPFDLGKGRRKTVRFLVQLPEIVEPGTQYARLYIYNGEKQRIVHREIEVTTQE